jgi:hypothetical protein
MRVGLVAAYTATAVALVAVPAVADEVHYEFLYDFGLFCG